jgi:hypothetical protein
MAPGTSAPRRARSDPRRAVLTTRCADRIRSSAPVGLVGRARHGRQRPSPTAVGREPARCAGGKAAMIHIYTPHRWRIAAIESEAAARKRFHAPLLVSAPGESCLRRPASPRLRDVNPIGRRLPDHHRSPSSIATRRPHRTRQCHRPRAPNRQQCNRIVGRITRFSNVDVTRPQTMMVAIGPSISRPG